MRKCSLRLTTKYDQHAKMLTQNAKMLIQNAKMLTQMNYVNELALAEELITNGFAVETLILKEASGLAEGGVSSRV